MFSLKHYFASKLSVADHEAFSNLYPEKEILNKITLHRQVTKFWNAGSVHDERSSSDKTAEIMAVPIPSSTAAATVKHG